MVRGICRSEYLPGARGGERLPEQRPANAGSAECRINDEKLDEIPAEEVSRLDDHKAGHGSVGDVHLALAEQHAVSAELGPLGVALRCEMISAQNSGEVICICAADPGRRLLHQLSLARSCRWLGAPQATKAGGRWRP